MADLNDDIKKYLNGELSAAEMHALEKKALNDPFLEEALEGAAGLDAHAFDSDLKNLKSSLEQRIARKRGGTVTMWVWPMRIAAGLILVALSTFLIVKLTENKATNDLALQKESPASPTSNENEELAADSAALSQDVTTERTAEPGNPNAKPQATAPIEREEYKRQPEADASKSGSDAAGAAADKDTQTEKEIANEQLALSTEQVPQEQPANDVEGPERQVAAKTVEDEAVKLSDKETQRSAASAPESRAKAAEGFVRLPKVITGRVVSEDGVGLPGVNVMFKNTNIGTVTDASGNYQIKVADDDPSLVFSFIGFTSEEVAAGDKTNVDVELKEDVSQLSEIVVMGNIADRKTDDEKPETLELANPYGGRRAYKQYLEKNIHYPEQALANNIEGRVTIQFTVESSGLLSDFRVIKGIGHGCDEEVIRLIKQGPKWNPTRRNTESLRDRVKVRMKFTLPKK